MQRVTQILQNAGQMSERMAAQIGRGMNSSSSSTRSLADSLSNIRSRFDQQAQALGNVQQEMADCGARMSELMAQYRAQESAVGDTAARLQELQEQYNAAAQAASELAEKLASQPKGERSTADKQRLFSLRQEMASLSTAMPPVSAQLQSQQALLASLGRRVQTAASAYDEIRSSADGAANSLRNTGAQAEAASRKMDFSRVGSALGSIGRTIAGVGISAPKSFMGLISGANSSMVSVGNLESAVKKLSGSFLNLGSMIVNRLKSALTSAIFSGVGDALKSLAAHSSSVGNALNSLAAGAKSVGANLVGAFAPLISAVMPTLTSFLNQVVSVVNAVSELIAKLFGASTWKKAVVALEGVSSGAGKAAGSTGKAAKAAEEYKRSVMGFDELNKLTDQGSSSGSGGGGGGGGGGGAGGGGGITWVDMPISDTISELADKLKEAWEKADFTEIGTMIGEKLRDALNSIPWEPIKETCNKVAKSVATFLNGFFETPGLFEAIGTTVGEAINTVFGAADTFLQNFHFDSLGTAVMTAINTAISTVDFSTLGSTFSGLVKGFYDTLGALIRNFDPVVIFDAIVEFLSGIDYAGIAQSMGEWLGTAWGKIIDIGKILGEAIANGIKNIGNYFGDEIDAAGGDIVQGILTGIAKAVVGIGSWIYDNVVSPFIDGFLDGFGIDSDSGSLIEAGKGIVNGILGGIKKGWETITNFFSTAIANIKAFFKDPVGTIKQNVSLSKSGWSTVADWVKGFVGGIVDKGITLIQNGWQTVSGWIRSGKLGDIVSKGISLITSGWKSVSDWVSSKLGAVVRKGIGLITDGWTSVAEWIRTKKLGGVVQKGIELISKFGKTVAEWLKEKMGSAVKALVDLTQSKAWTDVGTWVKTKIGDAVNVTIDLMVGAISFVQGLLDSGKFVLDAVLKVSEIDNEVIEKTQESYTDPKTGDTYSWGYDSFGNVVLGGGRGLQETFNQEAKKLTVNGVELIVDRMRDNIPTAKKKIGNATGEITDTEDATNGLTWIDIFGNIKKGIDKTAGLSKIDVWGQISKALDGTGGKTDLKVNGLVVNGRDDTKGAANISVWAKIMEGRDLTGMNSHIKATGDIAEISDKLSSEKKHLKDFLATIASTSVTDKAKNLGEIFSGILKALSVTSGAKSLGAIFSGILKSLTASNDTKKITGLTGVVSVTASWASGAIKKLKDAITTAFSGFGVWISGWLRKDGGGFYKNGAWSPIQSFATGGLPYGGQMFIARESGPELVGTMGGGTAVVNNDQIVASVAAGVAEAVASVLSAQSSGGDVVLYVDSTELARASLKGQRTLDRMYNPHIVFG